MDRYVDLLLGEFKHFKTRLAHGGIRKEVFAVIHYHETILIKCIRKNLLKRIQIYV